MPLTSNPFGIPLPGDAGVDGFLIVTMTGDAMHISTDLMPDELSELIEQITDNLDTGAEFDVYTPARPS